MPRFQPRCSHSLSCSHQTFLWRPRELDTNPPHLRSIRIICQRAAGGSSVVYLGFRGASPYRGPRCRVSFQFGRIPRRPEADPPAIRLGGAVANPWCARRVTRRELLGNVFRRQCQSLCDQFEALTDGDLGTPGGEGPHANVVRHGFGRSRKSRCLSLLERNGRQDLRC